MLAEVTYSTKEYEKARKYNVKMAYKKGKADKVFEYTEDDLDEQFKQKNQKILSCKRGAGYWVWKPYVVAKALEQLNESDYLFYCDSGAFVTGDMHILIQYMNQMHTDILFCALDYIEKEWTKRDIFITLDCDVAQYTESHQRCATYFMIKKTPATQQFVMEWLKYAQSYELISDADNVIHQQANYKGFRENRHDQSLLSVLSKKYDYHAYPDISQYRYPRGWKQRRKAKKMNKESTGLPIMICLHRQKKADNTSALREAILNYFPGLVRVLHYGYH